MSDSDFSIDPRKQFEETVFASELERIDRRLTNRIAQLNAPGGDAANQDAAAHAVELASLKHKQTKLLFDKHGAAIDPASESEARMRKLRELKPEANVERELAGLAFSGGGIRSAAFNLGVVQVLGKWRVLPALDYLSTVSGGGYLGSCISALMNGPGATWENFPLRGRSKKEQAEEPAIKRLRQHSKYLAPGASFPDYLQMPLLYLCGLFLNILIVLGILLVSGGATAYYLQDKYISHLSLGDFSPGGFSSFLSDVKNPAKDDCVLNYIRGNWKGESSTILASAAASMAPTMVAISKPPNSASTANGSLSPPAVR